MTVDAKTLLPIAERAVSTANEVIRTKAPGVSTAKGDRDRATEVDYAAEHAVRDGAIRPAPASPRRAAA